VFSLPARIAETITNQAVDNTIKAIKEYTTKTSMYAKLGGPRIKAITNIINPIVIAIPANDFKVLIVVAFIFHPLLIKY
jgi:hypothetical protein